MIDQPLIRHSLPSILQDTYHLKKIINRAWFFSFDQNILHCGLEKIMIILHF
jgi:hypothetical protein